MRSLPGKLARTAIPLSVLLTCQKLLANSGIQIPLTQFQAGTEKATLVSNGDFEQHGDFDSNGLTTQANNWSQVFGMYATNQPFNTPALNPSAIGSTVAVAIANQGSPDQFSQPLDISSLPAAHSYVLSAYIWNRGRAADSTPGDLGDLAVVKLVDTTDTTDNNISLVLQNNGSDNGSGATGYFVYDMISAAELATWDPNNTEFEVRGEDSTTTSGSRPDTWAQFDNIAFTPAENFVGQKWTGSSGGIWNTPANWNSQATPNFKGDIVTFSNTISTPQTITLNQAETCAVINLDSATASWTIAGPGQLTLDTAVHGSSNLPNGVCEVNVLSGSHTISANIGLTRDTVFDVINANSTLTVSGSVTPATGNTNGVPYTGQNFSKDGAGLLQMKSLLMPNITLLAGKTQMIPNGGAANASRIKSLTISGGTNAWTSQLDLSNDDMVIDYTGNSTPVATIQNQIINGYAGGSWNGQGIISSNAAASLSTSNKTGIGFIDTASFNPGTFDGAATNGNMVLMKYTLLGDANLDGTVNALDFNALATDYGNTSGTWLGGDFDYSGVVDSTDFDDLAANYNKVLNASDSMPLGAVVPEPTAMGLVIGGLLLAHRRRR